MKLDLRQVEEACKELYIRALKMLPPDIKEGFARLDSNETDATGKAILGTMIRNIRVAEDTNNQPAANATLMEILKEGGNGIVVRANVADPEQAKLLIETAIESYDKVDILVNNAGINRDRTIARMSVEEWDTVIRTDLS